MLKIIRRVFSFADWSRSHPREPHPGDMIDAQFDEIIDRIDRWDDRVRSAITDEGKIAPGAIDNKTMVPHLAESVEFTVLQRMRAQIDTVDRAAKLAATARDQADAALIRAEQLQAQAGILADRLQPAQVAALAETDRLLTIARETLAKAEKLSFDELNAANRADEANNNALLWAEVSQDWAEYMPDTIPPNTLAWMGISGEHWSARWWANRADNAFGRLTDMYLGAWPDPPLTNLEGGEIQEGAIYYDTDNGQMYVWTGSGWESLWAPQRSAMSTLLYNTTAGQLSQALTSPDLNTEIWTIDPVTPEGLDVHLNGVRLVRVGSGGIGDFTVDEATSVVTFKRPLTGGGILQVDILASAEAMVGGKVSSWSLKRLVPDGVKVTFALETKAAGKTVYVAKSEELVVSVDGVMQEPGADFTASGASITFAAAYPADSVIFLTWFEGSGA